MSAIARLRQVAYYLTPRLTEAERIWALGHLNPAQRTLFEAMGHPDQAHVVRVARRLAAEGAPAHAIEAALLHDCAKPAGYGLFWRSLGVVVAPLLADWPAEPALPGWRRWLQVYRWHDEYGLALAKEAGTSPAALALLEAYLAGPTGEGPRPDWLGPLEACDELG